MTIRRIDQDITLPFEEEAILSRDPARLAAFLKRFKNELERQLEANRDTTNLLVDNTDGVGLYSRAKDSTGQYPIGTWRLVQDGDNWVREVLTDINADTWTLAGRWKPAK